MPGIQAIIFDWGNTIMKDLQLPGPMKDWESVEWVPAAEKTLQELHGKYLLIIATSAAHSDRADMISALERVGAQRFFQYFFSTRELGASKPDPQFFENILSSLELDPQFCVSVGDKYLNDVEAAIRAGITGIWYQPDPSVPDPEGKGLRIKSLDELPSLLESMQR